MSGIQTEFKDMNYDTIEVITLLHCIALLTKQIWVTFSFNKASNMVLTEKNPKTSQKHFPFMEH